MSESILGDLKPPFTLTGKFNDLFATEDTLVTQYQVRDILNAIPELEAERDELLAERAEWLHSIKLVQERNLSLTQKLKEAEELLDRERLASLIHDEWLSWTHALVDNGEVLESTVTRWRKNWLPYQLLNEQVKDQDREWADKVRTPADKEAKDEA